MKSPGGYRKNFILDLGSILVLTVGFVVVAGSGVLAATQTYDLVWDAAQSVYTDDGVYLRAPDYRHVRLVDSTNSSRRTDWVCLGPAEWQVKGTLSDGKRLTERWRATSWQDIRMMWDPSISLDYQYTTASGCHNQNGHDSSGGSISNLPNWGIKPSGEYGAMILRLQGSANVYKPDWQAAESRPVRWEIKGCVYDGSENECAYNTR